MPAEVDACMDWAIKRAGDEDVGAAFAQGVLAALAWCAGISGFTPAEICQLMEEGTNSAELLQALTKRAG